MRRLPGLPDRSIGLPDRSRWHWSIFWVVTEEGIGRLISYEFQSQAEAQYYFDRRRVARTLLGPQLEEVEAAAGANPLALRSLRKKIISHRISNQPAAPANPPASTGDPLWDFWSVHEPEEGHAEVAASEIAAEEKGLRVPPINVFASEIAAEEEGVPQGCSQWHSKASKRMHKSHLQHSDARDELKAFEKQPGTSGCGNTVQVCDGDCSQMCKVVVMAVSGRCVELQFPMTASVRNVKERLGREWGTSRCNVKLMSLMLEGLSDTPDTFTMSRLCTRGDPSSEPIIEFTGLLVDSEWCALAKVGLDDLLALSAGRGCFSDLDRLALHTGRADARGLGKVIAN